MIVYKIRNKDNPELFLTGTPAYNAWDKTGRIFPSLGKLRTFITGALKYRLTKIELWEIVEMELTVVNVKGVHEVVKPEKIVELLKR